jgi:hypothetical protein
MIQNFTDEEWKNIPNSNYAISNIGRIKSLSYKRLHNVNKTFYQTKEVILKQSNNNSKKYWRFCIKYNNGTKIYESIHRLVAKAFIPNNENLAQVNHIDGNKDNNCVSNLEWVTNQQNNEHRFKVLKAFPKAGYKTSTKKLTEEQVKSIPKLLKIMSKKDIAAKFNVKNTTISEIVSGRSWRYLNLFAQSKIKSEKYFGLRYSPNLEEIPEKL